MDFPVQLLKDNIISCHFKTQIYSNFTNLLKTWCVKNLEVLLNEVLRIPLVSSPIPSATSSFDTNKHKVRDFQIHFSFHLHFLEEISWISSIPQAIVSSPGKNTISICTCFYLAYQQYSKTGTEVSVVPSSWKYCCQLPMICQKKKKKKSCGTKITDLHALHSTKQVMG